MAKLVPPYTTPVRPTVGTMQGFCAAPPAHLVSIFFQLLPHSRLNPAMQLGYILEPPLDMVCKTGASMNSIGRPSQNGIHLSCRCPASLTSSALSSSSFLTAASISAAARSMSTSCSAMVSFCCSRPVASAAASCAERFSREAADICVKNHSKRHMWVSGISSAAAGLSPSLAMILRTCHS